MFRYAYQRLLCSTPYNPYAYTFNNAQFNLRSVVTYTVGLLYSIPFKTYSYRTDNAQFNLRSFVSSTVVTFTLSSTLGVDVNSPFFYF